MGAKLSLLAPSAPTVAISSYVDILSTFKYVDLINNSRFLKTIRAIDKSTGNLIIIKILIKPAGTTVNYNFQLQELIELLTKQNSLLSRFNHVVPYHKIIETDRAGYLIRQMLKTNLYDRLSIRPFLENIEKQFLVFQILKIVDDCHKAGVHHGDLKLENFLVTSWNWLMLSDFSSYTKPVYIPEDNPSQFSFYFDTSDRRLCYLAPERFYNSKDLSRVPRDQFEDGKFSGADSITDEMELFSMGCTIAELYLDGEPTFTLSQLFKFVRGEYSPDLSVIQDEDIKAIIGRLIQFDPKKRSSASSLLHEFRGKCFPEFFYTFLYDFISDLNVNSLYSIAPENDNVSINDLKIDKIYANFDKIVAALGFQYTSPEDKPSPQSEFIPLKLNLPGMPYNYIIQPSKFDDASSQSALIILGVIFSLMKSLKQVSSKVKACELIVALSERINDECKLDRSIPYLCSLLDEFVESSYLSHQQQQQQLQQLQQTQQTHVTKSPSASKVVCTALTSITTLLLSCTFITPINVLMFPEYLLPKLSNLLVSHCSSSDKDTIKVTLAGCLPYLANVSKKFWMFSKSFKSNEPQLPDSDLPSSGFTITKSQLDEGFETLTFTLLTDPNPTVKISLLNNVLPLCQFFGVDKTNDIILPHLITYLNDANFHLRLAFLSSVLDIGKYVGVLSFEQYILPLLIQTLTDQEQFVVIKVLEIFNEFVQNRLINPRTEFNALEIYKELVVNFINLLLHPNEWIRQAVLNLIISISENLTDADRYCFLYPLIKGFLSYDVASFTWNSLYPCITKPLSRQVYELAITWSLNATPKSLFWQKKNFSTLSQLNNSNKKSMVSYSKNMGKSVYLPRLNSEVVFSLSNGSKSSVPLSPEDKQWLIKLKSVGLEDKDLWKIFVLRDYIHNVYRASPSAPANESFMLLENHPIIPRNTFFDISYKSESLSANSKTTESNVESSEVNPGDSISFRDFESGRNSFILPNFARPKASIQTVETNVFGELEMSHDSNHSAKHKHQSPHDVSAHRVFSVNSSKIITVSLKHSYTGYNPYILNYLNTLEFEPTLNDFSEFGHYVSSKSKSKKSDVEWNPTGILVAKIQESKRPDGNIDGINCVEVCPTSEFFVTGSEHGLLKVWSSSKLEKIITVLNPSLAVDLKSPITSIKFIPHRFVVGVTTADGLVRLYRIDVIRNKAKKIIKYTKLSLIRKFTLDVENDGYIVKSDYLFNDKQNLMVGVTSSSKIVGFDIIRSETAFRVQNPLIHGLVTTFIFDQKSMWLMVATSKGVISLWDMRFRILVSSWKVQLKQSNKDNVREATFGIRKLILLPKHYVAYGASSGETEGAAYFAMIGGSNEGDVTIWEIPSFECKQVLSSQVETPYVKNYSMVPVSNYAESIGIESLLKSLEVEILSNDVSETTGTNKSFTALKYVDVKDSPGYLLSAAWNRRMNWWNLGNLHDSTSINSEYEVKYIVNSFNRQSLVLVNETYGDKKQFAPKENYSLDEIAALQSPVAKIHQDTITDLDVLTYPFEMIVSVDRNGNIHIYK